MDVSIWFALGWVSGMAFTLLLLVIMLIIEFRKAKKNA